MRICINTSDVRKPKESVSMLFCCMTVCQPLTVTAGTKDRIPNFVLLNE